MATSPVGSDGKDGIGADATTRSPTVPFDVGAGASDVVSRGDGMGAEATGEGGQ